MTTLVLPYYNWYLKLKNINFHFIFQTFPRVVLNARGQLSQLNDSGCSESPLSPSELNELILYSIYGPGKYNPR